MIRLSGLQPSVTRRSRLWRAAPALVCASIVLASCGADSGSDIPENRQFANDPAPTRAATEIPTTAPTVEERDEPRGAAMATPADLLRTRGAPSTLYTISGNDLIILEAREDGLEQSRIDLPDGMEVLAIAASPTGDRVGVALRDPDSGGIAVRFYGQDSDAIGEPYRLGAAATPVASPAATPVATPLGTPVATPVFEGMDGPVSLAWEPQGNGVLLIAGNTLTVVDIETGVVPIEAGKISGTLLSAASSPTGEQILVHSMTDDGAHRVYLIQRDTGATDELFAMRTEPGTGLSEIAWLPTGSGIVFVQGEAMDGEVIRGQLFRYRFRDESPRLLATSGQGGPSATIRNVAPAPDGASIAYEIAVFDIDRWSTHSMWVRALKHESAALQLPVESGHTVTGIAWSSEGLIWRYTAQYGPDGDYVGVVAPDGTVREIALLGGSPAASPVASPGATPLSGATPVGSPIATPVGTPGATPIG